MLLDQGPQNGLLLVLQVRLQLFGVVPGDLLDPLGHRLVAALVCDLDELVGEEQALRMLPLQPLHRVRAVPALSGTIGGKTLIHDFLLWNGPLMTGRLRQTGVGRHCKQHFLYFFPLPQGQGSFRPTLGAIRWTGCETDCRCSENIW